ncbi:MAG TPA: hypothetical protein VIF14_05730 [Alphaproteobacteria bacterium]
MMRQQFQAVLIAVALAGGAGHGALAEEGLPKRGTTYTTDGEVTRYRQRENRSTTQIYILRGTEAKQSEKDAGIVLVAPDPPAKEKPKTRKVRRGKRTYTVPVE